MSFERNLQISQLLYDTLQVTNSVTEGMLTTDKCVQCAADMPYEWSYYYTLRDELRDPLTISSRQQDFVQSILSLPTKRYWIKTNM